MTGDFHMTLETTISFIQHTESSIMCQQLVLQVVQETKQITEARNAYNSLIKTFSQWLLN